MPKIQGSSQTFWWGFPTEPRPAEAFFLEGSGDGQFSWNALRFPWRLSLDFIETNDMRAAAHLNVINRLDSQGDRETTLLRLRRHIGSMAASLKIKPLGPLRLLPFSPQPPSLEAATLKAISAGSMPSGRRLLPFPLRMRIITAIRLSFWR